MAVFARLLMGAAMAAALTAPALAQSSATPTRPSFDGVWTNASATRLERPQTFAQLVVPKIEADALETAAVERNKAANAPSDLSAGAFRTPTARPATTLSGPIPASASCACAVRRGRHSVVEPADGKIPFATARRSLALPIREGVEYRYGDGEYAGPEDLPLPRTVPDRAERWRRPGDAQRPLQRQLRIPSDVRSPRRPCRDGARRAHHSDLRLRRAGARQPQARRHQAVARRQRCVVGGRHARVRNAQCESDPDLAHTDAALAGKARSPSVSRALLPTSCSSSSASTIRATTRPRGRANMRSSLARAMSTNTPAAKAITRWTASSAARVSRKQRRLRRQAASADRSAGQPGRYPNERAPCALRACRAINRSRSSSRARSAAISVSDGWMLRCACA